MAVSEQIDRVTSLPHLIEDAVGDLAEAASFTTWHRSPELTILHVVWPPSVDLFAHDHRMWARDRSVRRARGQHILPASP